MTTATRKFIITRSDLDETPIGAKHSLGEAEREAQYYADKDAEKVYISWQADNGQTICQPVMPRGTADYLEMWARNDASTDAQYFTPMARRIEQLVRAGKSREKVHEIMQPRAEAWAGYAVVTFTRMNQSVYGHPIRFTTDVQREAAANAIDYILDELEAGNSWE